MLSISTLLPAVLVFGLWQEAAATTGYPTPSSWELAMGTEPELQEVNIADLLADAGYEHGDEIAPEDLMIGNLEIDTSEDDAGRAFWYYDDGEIVGIGATAAARYHDGPQINFFANYGSAMKGISFTVADVDGDLRVTPWYEGEVDSIITLEHSGDDPAWYGVSPTDLAHWIFVSGSGLDTEGRFVLTEVTVAWYVPEDEGPHYDLDGDCYCEEHPCDGTSNEWCIDIYPGDCDDDNYDVNPGEADFEHTGEMDGIDNDCDGEVDEEGYKHTVITCSTASADDHSGYLPWLVLAVIGLLFGRRR